jgi:undecaprenyl-diphosphatase
LQVDYWAAILLALVQGLTEFLPISSSAHLILVPKLFGWTDQGLAFDVAVHFGTLLAVIWVFRHDIEAILIAWLKALFGREHSRADAHLGSSILIATIPVVIAGFLFENFVETQLRTPLVICVTTAGFGVLLWLADLNRKSVHDEHQITFFKAFLIGVAQMVALLPGTSRSGITITAGLGLGLSRETAARFSFLLSIPAIAGASTLEMAALLGAPVPVDWSALAMGLCVALASAYACIKLFLRTIERIGMLPFMLYRLALAAILFVIYI